MIIDWSTYFISNSEVPSCIQPNLLWHNRHLLIDSGPVYLHSSADKNVIFIDNLFYCSRNFKSWNELKREFNLAGNSYFSWMQEKLCPLRERLDERDEKDVSTDTLDKLFPPYNILFMAELE